MRSLFLTNARKLAEVAVDVNGREVELAVGALIVRMNTDTSTVHVAIVPEPDRELTRQDAAFLATRWARRNRFPDEDIGQHVMARVVTDPTEQDVADQHWHEILPEFLVEDSWTRRTVIRALQVLGTEAPKEPAWPDLDPAGLIGWISGDVECRLARIDDVQQAWAHRAADREGRGGRARGACRGGARGGEGAAR
jgi:hypothetical protein